MIRFWDASRNGKSERPRLIQKMQAGSCERQSQTGPEKQLHEINPLDIIPRRFRRRSYLVSGTIFLRALLYFARTSGSADSGTAADPRQREHAHEPLARTAVPAGGFQSDRAFALTVCGCIVALIAFKNLLNLFLLRYERRYIYDLYRCMSRRLYIEYHDRGLGFIKNTNSALLSRNVNFVPFYMLLLIEKKVNIVKEGPMNNLTDYTTDRMM